MYCSFSTSQLARSALLPGVLYLVLSVSTLQAQYYFGPEKITVILNPLTDIQERELPFDRNFFIRKYVHQSESSSVISASLFEVKDPSSYDTEVRNNSNMSIYATTIVGEGIDLKCAPSADKNDIQKFDAYDLLVTQPLKPNRLYDLVISLTPEYEERTLLAEAFFKMYFQEQGIFTENISSLIELINRRKEERGDITPIEISDFDRYYNLYVKPALSRSLLSDTAQFRSQLVKSLEDPSIVTYGEKKIPVVAFERTFILYNSTTKGFKLETRVKGVLQPDFGLIFYGFGGSGAVDIAKGFSGVTPYVGLNYLFRPFDGDIRLRQLPKNHVRWWQRLSVHGGLTLLSLSKDRYRENLFNSFNVMLGGGFRLSSTLKIVSGVVLYKRANDNPLYSGTSVNAIGYAGLSIDLRVRDVLGDVGKLLSGSK